VPEKASAFIEIAITRDNIYTIDDFINPRTGATEYVVRVPAGLVLFGFGVEKIRGCF